MDRRKILLVAAALVAVTGTALVFLYVRGADTRAEERFDTVEVLTAVTTIEAGESIDDAAANGKLAVEAVAKGNLLPEYQTSIDALEGQVATVTVYPGEQIVSTKFGGNAEATSALAIPKGMMAISVNLTDYARVSGFVNPGSEVSILHIATADNAEGGYSRLLLERVTVLGVGSTTPTATTTTDSDGQETEELLPKTLLTVAVDQNDAEKVTYADANGELAFGLLTSNSDVAPSTGVTSANLFE